MNETLKRHLISAANTFITTFLVTFGILIASIDITSWTAILAAAIGAANTAARATSKIVIEQIK